MLQLAQLINLIKRMLDNYFLIFMSCNAPLRGGVAGGKLVHAISRIQKSSRCGVRVVLYSWMIQTNHVRSVSVINNIQIQIGPKFMPLSLL